jgi:TPR repeat protein
MICAGLAGKPSLEAARSWFSQAANASHLFAQASSGDCCRMGLLDAHNSDFSEALYSTAAARNHIGAVVVLANALRAAEGSTPESLAEIFGLWLVKASAGHAQAQRNVSQSYLSGRGCIADPAAAARWFRAAGEQGDAEAEYQQARCYRKGYGVQKDTQTARFWLERTSAPGHPHALLGTL